MQTPSRPYISVHVFFSISDINVTFVKHAWCSYMHQTIWTKTINFPNARQLLSTLTSLSQSQVQCLYPRAETCQVGSRYGQLTADFNLQDIVWQTNVFSHLHTRNTLDRRSGLYKAYKRQDHILTISTLGEHIGIDRLEGLYLILPLFWR